MLAHLAHAGGKGQKIFLLQLRRHGEAQPRRARRTEGGRMARAVKPAFERPSA